MKTIKLTFNYDWPIFRQTPRSAGIWDDYRFVIDDTLSECDAWIVFTDHQLRRETCSCNKRNVVFLPGEANSTSSYFSRRFLQQFGKVVTVQREITGANVVYHQNANPWFVGKSFDELVDMPVPEKPKVLSIVSSSKVVTAGHRRRLDFALELKRRLGGRIDLYGRGIREFKDKWDVTAPYRFHIAIENDYCNDWVTEKFFDPILTYTYPVYYGCPNLAYAYMPPDSFSPIDIEDIEGSCRVIDRLLTDGRIYDAFISNAVHYRHTYLRQLQFFPMLARILSTLDFSLPKSQQAVSPDPSSSILRKIARRLLRR